MKTLPLFLLLFIVPVTANAMDEETNVETQVVVRTSPTTELDALCGGNNAKVDAGSVGAAFPSYPCETVRTDLALERLEGREGFKAGSTRFFLNARLFMRGISSVLFGLIGLG